MQRLCVWAVQAASCAEPQVRGETDHVGPRGSHQSLSRLHDKSPSEGLPRPRGSVAPPTLCLPRLRTYHLSRTQEEHKGLLAIQSSIKNL